MTVVKAFAAATAAVVVVVVCAAPALAAADPTTGYWTKTRVGAPLPLQPPDPAPEGGSWVSADPSGPVSVTAVRALADPDNVVIGLRLPVADAVGPTAVLVCPTTERWPPEQGGRLEAAPTADCATPIETRIEEDHLLVDLPLLLQTDVVDVLLTPAPDSAFSLTLERATAESVVQAPASSSAPFPASGPLPPPANPFPPLDSGFDVSTPADLGVPAAAPGPLLPEPALPGAAPEAPVPQPQAAAPAVAPPLAARPAAAAVDDRPVALMAVALLAGLAVLAVRLAAQPVAAPRHLGGGARLSRPEPAAEAPAAPVAASRGVGRFRAPRVRPPVRI